MLPKFCKHREKNYRKMSEYLASIKTSHGMKQNERSVSSPIRFSGTENGFDDLVFRRWRYWRWCISEREVTVLLFTGFCMVFDVISCYDLRIFFFVLENVYFKYCFSLCVHSPHHMFPFLVLKPQFLHISSSSFPVDFIHYSFYKLF